MKNVRKMHRQSYYIQMQKLYKIVTEMFEIDCKNKTRKMEYVNIRKIFIHVYKSVHNYVGINTDLADFLNCSHCTILYNFHKTKTHLIAEKDFRENYEKIINIYKNEIYSQK